MNISFKTTFSVLVFALIVHSTAVSQTVTELRSLGYSLIPAPQKTELSKKTVTVDGSWQVLPEQAVSQKITDILLERAGELHGLDFKGGGAGQIILSIDKNAVTGITNAECSGQAYKLTIKAGNILIEGNSDKGLFYGIQSFLQLLKPGSKGTFHLPEGTITDWPDLQLRFIHWDTKHHRDKMETLKRYIDQASFFKVNAIAFEMEDKYEYPRHPVIGHPNAFTKQEMQELTRYALDRYIQLVPNVQAPAHMSYVLKHKKFEHLRAEKESNYQACMCDEEAMQLIFDMYQDMIDATPGVKYFFVSTDEIYYAGICPKCGNEYNDANRSKIWVDYLTRVNKWMNERGRRVLAWVEFPLLPEDILKLPSDVIDGIMNPHKTQEWIDNEKKAGIKQLCYNSMQGAEFLFPNYFRTTYRGRQIDGRLHDVYGNVVSLEARGADLIGTFAAAWDDAGLHDETFWLGWATVTQYGWTKRSPALQQSIEDFMDAFYGYGSPAMTQSYMILEEGARFYEALWDRVPSKERGKGYGSSFGKGIGGDMVDLLLQMPPLPSSKNLVIKPSFREKYSSKIEKASLLLKKNDLLISRMMHDITRVTRNRYNLEVFMALAFLEHYTEETVVNLAKVEDYLLAASASGDNPEKAVGQLVNAYRLTGKIIGDQQAMWSDFTATWYKSRLPKNQNREGKKFYHQFDDVKDHFADRRVGLDYMLAPFERMKMEEWKQKLGEIITGYARLHNVPVTVLEVKRLED